MIATSKYFHSVSNRTILANINLSIIPCSPNNWLTICKLTNLEYAIIDSFLECISCEYHSIYLWLTQISPRTLLPFKYRKLNLCLQQLAGDGDLEPVPRCLRRVSG